MSEKSYENVCVLIISWKDITTSFTQEPVELAALKDVLISDYNYITEKNLIPSTANPDDSLGERLDKCRHDHGGPDNLLLLYYCGHGMTVRHASIEKDSTETVEILSWWRGIQEKEKWFLRWIRRAFPSMRFATLALAPHLVSF
jgi:hypothetical protein